uniref:Uncharacterized protein n=1 Tax=Acrobeloides nanus TaxID=290746 RepID=A0A914C8D2_9BILA
MSKIRRMNERRDEIRRGLQDGAFVKGDYGNDGFYSAIYKPDGTKIAHMCNHCDALLSAVVGGHFTSHRRLCQKGGFGPITPSQLLRKIRKSRNSLPVLKQESASHIEEEFPFQNILDAAKLSATEASELGETSAQDIEADPETMDLLPNSSTSSEHQVQSTTEPLQIDALSYGLDFLTNTIASSSRTSSDADAFGTFMASQMEWVASRSPIKGVMLKKELMDTVFKYQLDMLSSSQQSAKK